MIGLLRGAWRFRDFIVASVKREFASKYLGTQLGAIWPILHPLAIILIYTLVFAEIMKPKLEGHTSRFAYGIFLTSGFITWALFADLLTRSVGIFVANAAILKKVMVHKLALPIIAALSAFIQFAILLACFLAFLAFSGELPGAPILAIVPVLAITALFAMGLGLFLATINVFYRDIEQTTHLLLQFWFWLTPIVYPATALPQEMKSAIEWNPVWPLIRAMQSIFVDNRWPEWSALLYPLGIAIVLAFFARFTFERLSGELVDEL